MDVLDKRILASLDLGARRSDSQIGRLVHASASTVSYRIQRLIEQKVIRDFVTVINQRALGWHAYRVFLKTSALSDEQEKEFVSFFSGKVVWLVRCRGGWTYNMLFFSRSADSALAFLDSLISHHSKLIIQSKFSQVTKIRHFSRRYLSPTLESPQEWVMGASIEVAEIDEVDRSLLKRLQKNGRESSISLANSLDVSERIVRYRIKKLQAQGVILTFRPSLNLPAMGYQYCKLHFTLTSDGIKRRNHLLAYFSQREDVVYVTSALGGWNVEVEVQIPQSVDVYDIVQEVVQQFPDVVADYDVLYYDKEFDLSYMNVV